MARPQTRELEPALEEEAVGGNDVDVGSAESDDAAFNVDPDESGDFEVSFDEDSAAPRADVLADEGAGADPTDGSEVPEAKARLLYQLDDDIVEAASKLVEERARYEELLSAARDGRDKVAKSIYERVVTDYQERLEGIESEYAPLRERILEHVRGVMKEERGVRQRLEEINEVVEELRFRRQLGEFDDDEFDERRQESTGELTDLDEKLSCIESLYRTVRTLLGRDADPVLDAEASVSPLSADAVASVSSPPASDSPPNSGPAFDKTAVMSALDESTPQSQTVIVAAPGGAPHVEPASTVGESDDAERVVVTPLTPDVEGPVVFEGDELVLGRSTTCDVVLPGATVSRRHALLRRGSGGLEINDISSGGGVLVNGERVESVRPVEYGDQIQIGTAVLRIDR